MKKNKAPFQGPHQERPWTAAGSALTDAEIAMIMIHGRGADARDILSLGPELQRDRIAFLAPTAAGNTWYPNSFLAPMPSNEPGLSSGLQLIDDMLAHLAENDFPAESVILLGFSQGACLSLEYTARNPQRYGGIAGLSGGLIGPPDTPRDYPGSLAGTPVFLGCSDVDFHIPKERVQETTRVLSAMGANVQERLYPGMGHTVNMDEIAQVQLMVDDLMNAQ